MAKKKKQSAADQELSADDLAMIGAGLTILGDLFALLALVKAKQEDESSSS
ncbi:hypothetical protein [Paenibacillus sp. CAA11]|uniref:hypothetical protein n=1 Tax=Paenibacillus sp. CAA11 TaxID=1532905 RepID=UPI00190109E8|nr:hypothetical protein [Paenibacillus sp. CAA11]